MVHDAGHPSGFYSVFLTICILCLTDWAAAQKNPDFSCPSDLITQDRLEYDTAFIERTKTFNERYRQRVKQGQQRASSVVYTLPAVVHIIHSGEPVGSQENPSDATVQSIIDEATLRFRHQHPGAGNYANPFYGADTEIEFCLAQVDPDGDATTGIIRYNIPALAVGEYNDLAPQLNAYAWDINLYVNLFVISEMTNASGVYYGPFDFTIYDSGAFWSGLVAHEQGHYLFLRHTFFPDNMSECTNDDCLNDGDFICDTPPKFEPGYLGGTCPNPGNSCTTDDDDTSPNNPYRPVGMGGMGDQPDMLESYMDYTAACWDAFTEGQKTVMRLDIETFRMPLVNHGEIACNAVVIPGCTNPSAHNYDPEATEDDGSCETCDDGIQNGDETDIDCGGALCATCPIYGCADPLAHNYNPEATEDDGSCETCNDGIQNGDETDIDCGGFLCDACPIPGCIDPEAHNYNPIATQDDGSCETCDDGVQNGDETGIDCGGVLCDACPIFGCLDPDAHNYNPNATQDNGSCETCDDGVQNGDETGIDCGGVLCSDCLIPGCTDPDAHNYNPNATQDNGSCETCDDGVQNGDETGTDCGGALCNACPVPGCTDPDAHNYDPNATVDDGSCETCDDGVQNGDETGIDCGGAQCTACPVPGCTDPDAHNYDPNATQDDGSCETCDDGTKNGDETGIDCGSALCSACSSVGCTDPDAHNYNPNATQDDGSCETCGDSILNGDETEVDCGGELCLSCPVAGCTDPSAHNFNPAATQDDGSCETCDDGVQNGDEREPDCGGALCDACPPLSTSDAASRGLQIFPVPARSGSAITIVLSSAPSTSGTYTIYTLTGRTIAAGNVQISVSGSGQITLHKLVRGAYILRVTVDGEMYTGKLIVL